MAKQARCDCGFVARGETVEEVLSRLEAHVRSVHPDLVGVMTREDMLAMIEDA
jgi:predicted small metal-binding protein